MTDICKVKVAAPIHNIQKRSRINAQYLRVRLNVSVCKPIVGMKVCSQLQMAEKI